MGEGRKRGREGCKERRKRGKVRRVEWEEGGRNERDGGKTQKKMKRIKGRNEALKKERKVEKKAFQQTTWQFSS